jgi:regulator of RNase E activity RraA
MDDNKRKEILDTVAKLRVTDIRDGLDWIGLHHVGSVDPEIRPLYRTKAAGFAQTYRHIPTQQRVPEMSPEDYTKWAFDYWYGQMWGDWMKYREQVREGDFLVIDTMGQKTPAVGSSDSLVWAAKGVKGVLTNGGARDTDEQLYQKALPVWHRWVVQPMYQGRVEFGGEHETVEIGGAKVKPGDLIVADGDGAITTSRCSRSSTCPLIRFVPAARAWSSGSAARFASDAQPAFSRPSIPASTGRQSICSGRRRSRSAACSCF